MLFAEKEVRREERKEEKMRSNLCKKSFLGQYLLQIFLRVSLCNLKKETRFVLENVIGISK
jgi:hypothetical protein